LQHFFFWIIAFLKLGGRCYHIIKLRLQRPRRAIPDEAYARIFLFPMKTAEGRAWAGGTI
jgi:hypothetical protein